MKIINRFIALSIFALVTAFGVAGYGQSQTAVGHVSAGVPSLSVSASTLEGAFALEANYSLDTTFHGAGYSSVHIDQTGGTWYLVGDGNTPTYMSCASFVELRIDGNNDLYLNANTISNCASTTCTDCTGNGGTNPCSACSDKTCAVKNGGGAIHDGLGHLGNFY